MEELARRKKKETPPKTYAGRRKPTGLGRRLCRRPSRNKKTFPAFLLESGEHLYIAYYRSFLSSSSTEYGIARLPQPVPMEMCVLRVPW